MTDLPVTETPSGVCFDARVTPRASKNVIAGVRDGRLLIKVTAPPVDAAANAAVTALLADLLGVPKRRVTLVAGERARTKRFVVAGLTGHQVRERLAHPST